VRCRRPGLGRGCLVWPLRCLDKSPTLQAPAQDTITWWWFACANCVFAPAFTEYLSREDRAWLRSLATTAREGHRSR